MKKIILLLSVILALNANASHQVAGDIGYKCLGNNQYEFYVYFYRDCAGIPAPTSLTLSGTSSCGNVSFPLNQVDLNPNDPNSMGILDSINNCGNNITTCNGGWYPGDEIYKYVSDPIMISPCVDWDFCASTCCRNPAPNFPPYTPSTNYSGSSMSYTCAMNNADGTCDDSPIWKQAPLMYVCQGIEITIDNGAVDPDGDSLVFELITLLNGCGSDTINYNPPFSASYPLSTITGTFPFNQSTGISTFTATVHPFTFEVTAIGVKISSYRNNVFKGSVLRDMQVVTLKDCVPLTTHLSEVNPSNTTNFSNDTFTVYAGDTFMFSMLFMDTVNNAPFLITNSLTQLIPATQFVIDTIQGGILNTTTTLLTDSTLTGSYNFEIKTTTGYCLSTEYIYPYVLQILPTSANPFFSVGDKLNNSFKIYPNPTTDNLTIKLPKELEKAHVSILDITGRMYKSIQLTSNSTSVKLDVPKGIYFVKIESDNNTVVKKLIVE